MGSPLGLLSPLVTDRLSHLPPGALRPSDLDALLVTERIFGPLGAAIQASVFITLATHPGLRAEADRLDAADAALDDTVDPHDPQVEELAAQHCAHHKALLQAIEAAGLDVAEEKLFEIYDADLTGDEEDTQMSAFEAVAEMPLWVLRGPDAVHRTHGTAPSRGPLRRQLIAGVAVREDPGLATDTKPASRRLDTANAAAGVGPFGRLRGGARGGLAARVGVGEDIRCRSAVGRQDGLRRSHLRVAGHAIASLTCWQRAQ
ncbi:hypothetical protein SVIOM74S_02681 [Streptomyces violarus]